MLGKLMKYEWRGYKVSLIVIFAILLSTTLLTAILINTINPNYDEVVEGFSVTLTILSGLLYYFGIIGCTIGSMLMIAIRFYKTCYTDQGYLTHTLPASPAQILASKVITAILQYISVIIGIVTSASILIKAFILQMIKIGEYDAVDFSLSSFFAEVNNEFAEEFGISFTAYIIFILVFVLLSCISTIITTFGCVSLGQLFTKHRIIGAIVAYFGINTILQIVSFIASIPMFIRISEAEATNQILTPFEAMTPTFIITMVISVIMAIVMYFVSLHMMTKKLNLE